MTDAPAVPSEGTSLRTLGDELTCKSCQFWQEPDADSRAGQCRRRAPEPRPDEKFVVWPRVRGSDWCGEHSLYREK